MEIAQLVVSPAILLGAFIFFWKESKAGRSELETRLVQRMDRMEDRLEARIVESEARTVALERKMDSRFAAMEDRLEARFAAIDTRFVALEDKMDKRFNALEDKMDTRIGRLEGVLTAQREAS